MSGVTGLNVGASGFSVPPQVGGEPALNQIMALLNNIRPLMSNGQAYNADTTLGDVGFTSLEMVNVMLAVETAFDLMIPAGDITPGNFKTAASIAAMIARLKPGA
jgi:acyl carrier protein